MHARPDLLSAAERRSGSGQRRQRSGGWRTAVRKKRHREAANWSWHAPGEKRRGATKPQVDHMDSHTSLALQSAADRSASITGLDRIQQAPSARAVLGAAVIILAVVALPLLSGILPPLVDLPAHLARLEIIDQLLNHGPLSSYYDFAPGLVPNLLFDGMGWAMANILPIGAVGTLYILFVLSVQLFGTIYLHHTLTGKYSYWPLLSALFLYNLDFFYGFLSYLAGVGLALLFLGLWIACSERRPLLRAAVGSVAALVLFLSHIIPFIIYAAAVAGYELQGAFALRRQPGAALGRLSVGAAQFLLPAWLFLRATPTVGFADEPAVFLTQDKIASLLAMPTSGAADLDVWLLAAGVVVAGLAVLAIRVRFAARFGAAFACVLAAFAIMPWGLGPVVDLDTRMPLPIFLIAIAATDVTLKRRRLAALLACAVVAILIARTVGVSAQTAQFSEHLDAYRAAFSRLQTGGVLFVGIIDDCPGTPRPGCTCGECRAVYPMSLIEAAEDMLFPDIYVRRLDLPSHIAALATIDRNVFVPQIFATRGLQPIAVRARLEPLKALQEDDPISMTTPEMMHDATAQMRAAADATLPGRPVYLLLQRIEGAPDLKPENAEIIASGPQFTLFQLAGPPLTAP
jgi:hypothetical protein